MPSWGKWARAITIVSLLLSLALMLASCDVSAQSKPIFKVTWEDQPEYSVLHRGQVLAWHRAIKIQFVGDSPIQITDVILNNNAGCLPASDKHGNPNFGSVATLFIMPYTSCQQVARVSIVTDRGTLDYNF